MSLLYRLLLYANYRGMVPLISQLSPQLAYPAVGLTGRLGKPLRHHTSFLYDHPAAPAGIASLMKYLKTDRKTAEDIIKEFYTLETRWELENRWLAQRRDDYLDQIVHMDDVRTISKTIADNGPMLLLTAHTAYFCMVFWALCALGNKISVMTNSARSAVRSNRTIQQGNIRLKDGLSAIMPLIFVEEGGSIKRSVSLIKEGYTVIMLIDIPDNVGKGTSIRMFDADFTVPAGCLKIREESGAPVLFFFPYAESIEAPYRVEVSPPIRRPAPLSLQVWADRLEAVIRKSPASWFGWFLLGDMADTVPSSPGPAPIKLLS